MAELELTSYFGKLFQVYNHSAAYEDIKEANLEVLKAHSKSFNDELYKRTPVSSATEEHKKHHHKNYAESAPGALRRSIMKDANGDPVTYKQAAHPTRVGYVIGYDGYNPKKRPYPLIGNALNKGWKLRQAKDTQLNNPIVHDVSTGKTHYWSIAAIHQIRDSKAMLVGMDAEIDRAVRKVMEKRRTKYGA